MRWPIVVLIAFSCTAANRPLWLVNAMVHLLSRMPASEDDLAGRGRVAVLWLPGHGDRGVVGQADRRPQLDGARAAAHMEGADGDQPVRPLHPGLVIEARRGGRQFRDVQGDGPPGGR